MAQLVASVSGVVLGGVAEVVGSNLARGKICTASIGSVDSLYPSVYIYIYIYIYIVSRNHSGQIPHGVGAGYTAIPRSMRAAMGSRERAVMGLE